VHLEIMAIVSGTVEGGPFQNCHNQLGAGHILATVAHKLGILGWRCW